MKITTPHSSGTVDQTQKTNETEVTWLTPNEPVLGAPAQEPSAPDNSIVAQASGLCPEIHSSEGCATTSGSDTLPKPFAAVSNAEALKMSLSPAQRTAIEMLTSGHTMVETANVTGVNRVTIYRWLKGDAAFVAAYNAWQQDVLDTARGRLLALSDLAVTAVAKALAKGDAKIGLRVLKSMGPLERPKPGPTDPDEVERQQTVNWQKAKNKLRKDEAAAEWEALMPP